VPNSAEPPALTILDAFPPRSCMRAVFSALRARIPHANGLLPRKTVETTRGSRGFSRRCGGFGRSRALAVDFRLPVDAIEAGP
jgi:hypothetical protein